jgi:hypothetical protein
MYEPMLRPELQENGKQVLLLTTVTFGTAEMSPCKPNAQAYIVDREVFIYARKRIAPGEEITIDYGEDYWNEHIAAKGCRCAHCAEARSESQPKVINGIGASAV